MYDQIKQFIKSNESELILALGVLLISIISFSAGRLTTPGADNQSITIEYLESSAESNSASSFENITNSNSLQGSGAKTRGTYIASKNSSKYHLPDCAGAARIAEHNKIWFNSKEEAESLGYQPASNCPGLLLP